MTSPTLIEGIARQSRQPLHQRYVVLYVLLGLACATLLGRSFYLQLWQGSKFLAAAEGNRVSIAAITAPRGIMYDARGKQLVENIASTDLVLDPVLVPSEEFEAPLIEKLPQYLPDLKADDIKQALQTTRQKQRLTILAKALDHDTVLRLEEAQAELPGIRLVSSLVRKYPYEQKMAHLLGYAGSITAEELTTNPEYIPTDITGKIGIERQYDALLHGKHGAIYTEVNASGQPQKELGQEESISGSELRLSLDADFQEYIYQVMSDLAEERSTTAKPPVAGAVVALDPRSGAVRALVSFPAYDPNVFSQPSLAADAPDIFKEPLQPLFNRVTDGSYPPGSTIKPLLASAALQENVITPQTTVLSTGGLQIGPWNFPDWKSGGHGQTEVTKAIADSVNTYFYLLAGGDGQRPGLGIVRIKQYLDILGWGKPTGIDLPTETAGFLPSPEWKEATKNESWYIGDTYHLGIGQGDVLASPLQITAAIGALANGGTWHTPYVVEKIVAPNQVTEAHSPQAQTIPIRPQHLDVVRSGMRRTVVEGSGRSLAELPLELAGKTGTAQIGGTEETHAWFTSFGPYSSPELVLTVLLERGGEGDKDAVPVAKKLWQWWYENRSPK